MYDIQRYTMHGLQIRASGESNGAQGRAVKHTKNKKGGKHYHNGTGLNGKGKGTKDYGKDAGKVDNNVHYEYPE
jgi:hypothetical protein